MTMKPTLAIILTLVCLTASGQTAQGYLKIGIQKHKQQDFKGAIKDYNKAINANKELKEAYFNRGTCELALKDFKGAMSDFSKTIELDPQYIKAYYSRASAHVSQEQYLESLPDLDKTIALDPSFPNALTLRGQIRAQTGDKKGACQDFTKAKENGDAQADQYLSKFCGNDQQSGESLMLYWPENENWKVGADQENEQTHVLDLIRS